MSKKSELKVTIVHDYLHTYAGGEKVVEELLNIYPNANLVTTFFVPNNFPSDSSIANAYESGRLRTSFLQNIFINKSGVWKGFWKKMFKPLFWIWPIVSSQQVVKDQDLVIISSVYNAKYTKLVDNKKVVLYCHSPTRFLHGMSTELDHSKLNPVQKLILEPIKSLYRRWDLKVFKKLSDEVEVIANSEFIKGEIKRVYGADSKVVYPPVEIGRFKKLKKLGDEYLFFGRIARHKTPEVVIEACIKSGQKLNIVGGFVTEEYENELKQYTVELIEEDKKNSEIVEFHGRLSDADLRDILVRTKVMLFPGVEDFGIAPVELISAGIPVIAYNEGGAKEWLINGENGVLFNEQSSESLEKAMLKFEGLKLELKNVSETVDQFSQQDFHKHIKAVIDNMD